LTTHHPFGLKPGFRNNRSLPEKTMMTTTKMLPDHDTKTPVLLVAIDMGLKRWHVAMMARGGAKRRYQTVAGGDYLALSEAVLKAKDTLGLAEDAPVILCYEAGRDGFYPYRRLTESGYRVYVIDAASIEVSRRKRRANSDGIDVAKLIELLNRYEGGEKKALRVVNVPSEKTEDLRQLPREREELLAERQQVWNRMSSLLFLQGYREIPGSARELKQWLAERQGVGPYLRSRLEREWVRLELLESQLKEVERKEAAWLPAHGDEALVAKVARLTQLGGFGVISAWVWVTEVFGWRGFRHRREVGGALGLTPTPYSSGEEDREQGIRKAGNWRARKMLIELTWCWLRYQPDSTLSQGDEKRFGRGSKRQKRVGIVALARRLAVAIWRYLDYGVVPEGARLKGAAG
jgi:transposase